MKYALIDLFAYTRWANKKYIDLMLEHKVDDEKAISWMSHIFNAYEIWLSRIEHYKPNYEIWEDHALKEMKELNESYTKQVTTLIHESSDADLYREIKYNSTSEKAHTSLLKDILIHMANHSTHHRAQIAGQLSKKGLKVPATDYIYFKRD